MKKTFGALAAVALMAGLVGGPAGSASALPGGYPDNSVDTKPKAKLKKDVEPGDKPKLKVDIVGDGNKNPNKGTIRVCVERLPNGGKECREHKYDPDRNVYPGPRVGNPGKYRITVKFIAREGSRWSNSIDRMKTNVN